MAVPMQREREGMSLDDFLASDENFEIINGRIVERMPNFGGHSLVIRFMVRQLEAFLGFNGRYEVFYETTFILPAAEETNWVKGSRIPDIMLLDAPEFKAWTQAHPDFMRRPFPIIPVLVIEVISETDRLIDIDEKVDLYLYDGVKLVWLIDPIRKKVTAHAPDFENPVVLKNADILDGGDVLPGFRIPLPELFALK